MADPKLAKIYLIYIQDFLSLDFLNTNNFTLVQSQTWESGGRIIQPELLNKIFRKLERQAPGVRDDILKYYFCVFILVLYFSLG